MKGKIWIKSMLEAYNYIGRVVGAIDKRVLNKGVKSHFTFGYNETLGAVDAILFLVERKRKLSAIKFLIEDSLKVISQKSAKTLMLRFMDKLTDQEIANVLKVSKRTVQRMLDKALGECYLAFLRQGYSAEVLQEYLKDDKWLVGIYNNNLYKSKLRKDLQKIPPKISFNNFLWN